MVNPINFVIGSGPSGVSAAKALLDRKQTVVMLDVGMTLEAGISDKVATLRRSSHESWDPTTLAEIKQPFLEKQSALPLKYLFGSDFPYRWPERCFDLVSTSVGLRPSFARGGFSNVWGASILPYADLDLHEWPIGVADFAPYYRRMLDWIGFVGQKDDLSDLYPLYGEPRTSLQPSTQAQVLLTRLKHNAVTLKKDGLAFGASRLAIRPNLISSGCVYCGLCMVGCPFDLIYHSGESLDQLVGHSDFSYRSGIHVNRLKERDGKVDIFSSQVSDGTAVQFTGDRVFLAAGVMSSSAILLRSMGNGQRHVEIQDSQYFLIPALMLNWRPDSSQTPLHTLSQLFLEIRDPQISPYTVHLQVYTYNEVYRSLLIKKLGPVANVFPSFLEKQILDRLIVLQGYLHSSHSGKIRLEIGPDHSTAIKAEALSNTQTREVVERVYRYLNRHSRKLGFIPIPGQLHMSEVGRGFHSGGSFPMQDKPQTNFASDRFGRPKPFQQIHVVDASVFTTIPSTTITLSTMANAYRIADTFVAEG
jgi:choline dehydrogenase-like flavoprotein